MSEPTAVERILRRIKNNPVVALFIVAGVIVIGLSSFTNAARNLIALFPGGGPAPADVNGTWVSAELTNPFQKNDVYTLEFDFQVRGEVLLGSMRQRSTRGDYNSVSGILEGTAGPGWVSFHTTERSIYGDQTVDYKDFFDGKLNGDAMEFIWHSDRPWGFPPQTFVVQRQP